MGTKHGYTHKKCRTCGQVKPRSEFRVRGGLDCKPCHYKKEWAQTKKKREK